MKVWVLFIWMSGPLPQAATYKTQADYQDAAAIYKHAACMSVVVPK